MREFSNPSSSAGEPVNALNELFEFLKQRKRLLWFGHAPSALTNSWMTLLKNFSA
jgi:hypothetical protein